MKIPAGAVHVIVLLTLAGYVGLFGSLVGAWHVDPPAGYTGDTFKQLYKAKLVSDFFPNLAWDHYWSAGIPSFRAYPLWPYYLLTGFSSLTGLQLERSLAVLVFAAYTVIGLGVYLAVFQASGSRFLSISTALFLLATPAIWSIHVVFGLYNEVLGLVFLPFILMFAMKISAKIERKSSISREFKLLTILVAAAISLHPLIGSASLLSALMLVLASKTALPRRFASALSLTTLVASLDLYLVLPVLTSDLPNVANIQGSLHTTTTLLGSLLGLPTSQSSFTLLPLAWPLTVAAIALAIHKGASLPGRVLALISLGVISALFTLVAGQLALNFVSFVLLSFFLAAILGHVLAEISRVPHKDARMIVTATATVMLLISFASPALLTLGTPMVTVPDPTIHAANALALPPAEHNYRVAISGADAWTSQWFNYRFAIPQTSSYAGLSLINLDWNAWFGEIWQGRVSPVEAEFLLEWWGVKWILIDTDINNPSLFLQNSQDYTFVANLSGENYLQFEYTKAVPILTATNAYAILMVGDNAAYSNFVRALSFGPGNSQLAVPVRDRANLEDYSLEELRAFDVIFLYGFNFTDREGASRLLDQYVREGGSVLIDTGYSGLSSSPDLPNSFPVSGTFATNFGQTWQFTRASSDVFDGIAFAEFAPPVYANGPWGISTSTNESVRSWATPILWDAGHPVIVLGQYGEGRVLWTGLNLAYHILSYRNQPESGLLSRMIEWLAPRPLSDADFSVRRPDPQHITVEVHSDARGVLFRENFYPGWKASVLASSPNEVRVWKAGPDFMYVRFPSAADPPLRVSFEFAEGITLTFATILSGSFLVVVVFSDKLASAVKVGPLRRVAHWIERVRESWEEE